MRIPKKLTTEVKKQHTVPRFLLDHFGFGKKTKKRQLFTFDKENKRTYQQSVFDATTRNTFYNIENHPEKYSLEPILGEIETEASAAINKIIQEGNLATLNEDERVQIAIFVVIQKARTFHGLQSIKELTSRLSEKLLAQGCTPEDLPKLIGSQKESDLKNFFLKTVLDHVQHIEHILNKSWILYQTSESDPFYISDNPVTLHNDTKMGFYGNLGLAVKGIQVHLPISSTLTLAFVCPSHEENAIRARDQLHFIIANNARMVTPISNPAMIIEYAKAYEEGLPMKANSENVKFLNSLQVTFAEQYLFCLKNDFKLAVEMITDNGAYKTGLRPTVN